MIENRLLTSQDCPMCGSSSTVVEFVKDDGPWRWSLGRCTRCGLHFTDPRPTPEYLEKRYSGDYHKQLRTEGGTRRISGPSTTVTPTGSRPIWPPARGYLTSAAPRGCL